jgi:hypothetical protein
MVREYQLHLSSCFAATEEEDGVATEYLTAQTGDGGTRRR